MYSQGPYNTLPYNTVSITASPAAAGPFAQTSFPSPTAIIGSIDSSFMTQRNRLLLDADQLMPQIWM